MQVFDKIKSLQTVIQAWKAEGLTIGFVPTMGALHPGHLSLVKASQQQTDRVVCSIFVNPTQFNNPDDLKRYPRMPEADRQLLEAAGVHGLFTPDESEIYPDPADKDRDPGVDLGGLERVMEAALRPGHFRGVMQVVSRLFDIVRPDVAFFGEKDFQQLAVIREMTRQLRLPVRIVGCPTLREPDGLAMSSRNLRLSAAQRQEAAVISRALFYVRDNIPHLPVDELLFRAKEKIEASGHLKLEYLCLADEQTLEAVHPAHLPERMRCCVAAWLGDVRLIDNVGIVLVGS
jgi:pantoate--beta-alanine ligase